MTTTNCSYIFILTTKSCLKGVRICYEQLKNV
nr:MAG TPA: hypothetical protein [Caudoviricetes sp.]